jgi:hypothetical protein
MSHQISPQHPTVVLRSHYVHMRTLLVIAMIAVVSLAAVVVILATRDEGTSAASTLSAPTHATQSSGTTRFDGGPEEGTRGALVAPLPPPIRYAGPR